MDGTFKTAPKLFLQLYVLHGPIGECTIPLVYAFLETKDQETYNELFTVIQRESLRRNHLFMPPVIHIDFELAVINAYRALYTGLYNVASSTLHKIPGSIFCS